MLSFLRKPKSKFRDHRVRGRNQVLIYVSQIEPDSLTLEIAEAPGIVTFVHQNDVTLLMKEDKITFHGDTRADD